MIDWKKDEERRAELERLYRAGVSLSKIAVQMKLTRGAVSGAIHRVILKVPDKRSPGANAPRGKGSSKCWTEATLTEKWADRKARRARERAEAERAQRA